MNQIMFVCTGNKCRSPFAAAVLQKMFADIGLGHVGISSCGTCDLGREPRDPMMVKVAADMGYTLDGETTYMDNVNWHEPNLIIAMSQYHRNELTKEVPYDKWNHIELFNEYFLGTTEAIEDPHYQTEAVYRKVAEQIVAGCAAFTEKIRMRLELHQRLNERPKIRVMELGGGSGKSSPDLFKSLPGIESCLQEIDKEKDYHVERIIKDWLDKQQKTTEI